MPRRRSKINTGLLPYASFLLLAALVALQTAVVPILRFDQVSPNFVLTLILAWSLNKDLPALLAWALIGGMALDLLAGTPLGLFAAGFLAVAALGSFWRDKSFGHPLLLPVLLAWPYTFLFHLLILAYWQSTGVTVAWGALIRQIIFPEAVLNMTFMVFLYPLLLWLDRLGRRDDLTI